MLRRGLAEILEEGRVREGFINAARVLDVLGGKLNDGTGFDVSLWSDMVTNACRHGAEGIAIVIVISVDDGDRLLRPHVHDKASGLLNLGGAECEIDANLGTDRAIGVIPSIVYPEVDELVEPRFTEQVIDIRPAKTCGYAGEKLGIETMLQTAQGSIEYILVAATFVAHRARALDTHERCGIAELAQGLRGLLGDELTVRENLKIGVGMLRDQIEQLGMHEGLAAEDAEEAVAVRFGIVDRAIERIEIDGIARGFHIDPATLATEVATVEDGEVKEGRKVSAFLHPLFEEHDRARSLVPEVPGHLGEAFGIDGAEDAAAEGEDHESVSR